MLAFAFILITIILFIASPFAFFWTYRRPAGSEFFGFAGRGLVAGLVAWTLLIVPLGLYSSFYPYLLYYFPVLPFAALAGIVLTLTFRLILKKTETETRGIIRALLGAVGGILIGGAIGVGLGFYSGYSPEIQALFYGILLGFLGIFSGIMAGEASS